MSFLEFRDGATPEGIMKTAIIADDEPIIRMDLNEMLTEIGFKVVAEAEDGFEAIECAKRYQPDCVLMDIKMPVVDGLTASKTILEENSSGCIVIMTAFYDIELIEQAKEIGVRGYLVKPVNEKMLFPVIEMAMEQSRQFQKIQMKCQNLENKIEDSKKIEKAKRLLSVRDKISEREAYDRMRKMSMNRRCTVPDIADLILQTDHNKSQIEAAKAIMMKKYRQSEDAAYRRMVDVSMQQNISLIETARKIIRSHKNESR